MKTSLQLNSGKPFPLGATVTANGCNFAIYSEHASSVYLCLFDEAEHEVARIPLPNRTGHVWHGQLEGVTAGQRYGYRVDGLYEPEQGHLFNESKLLIDPYAKLLSRTLEWHRSLLIEQGQGNSDSAQCVPKAVVYDNTFDWQDQVRPTIAAEQRVIYEVHVKGFTQQHPDVKAAYRGKYLGLIEPNVLQYLTSLGITTVQLMPCFSFMTEARLDGLGLSNYWGYNPVNFFAPDWRYAIDDPVAEFKTMVRELHRAGFEVILDVVYNHTAEGPLEEGACSLKGIDNRVYYRYPSDTLAHYENATGCGNTVNIEHPQVTQLVLDSMRYWVEQMGMDGFRFDLAPVLGRNAEGFDRNAAIFAAIRHDPVLSRCLLVAEPWDIGHHGYQLGSFPDHWGEVNDKYRDTVRRFWRGDDHMLPDFCTRLMGSRDVFAKAHRPHTATVNHVTYHDGFTLHDLCTYNERHNHANGEDNRDGHGHNLGENFGVEGETQDSEINADRQRYQRNMLATLLLSRGTPHVLAGDELSRTQQGNNNAYCQDNDISWLQWQAYQTSTGSQQLLAFYQQVLQLREQGICLNYLALVDEPYFKQHQHHQLQWLNQQGGPFTERNWQDVKQHFIALHYQPQLSPVSEGCGDIQINEADGISSIESIWLFNASDIDETFQFPIDRINHSYECLLSTGLEQTGQIYHQCVRVPAKSLMIIRSHNPDT